MSKKLIYSQLKPFLDEFSTKLVKELTQENLIIENSNIKGKFHIIHKQPGPIRFDNLTQRSIFTQLFELRNIATNVCSILYPETAEINTPMKLSKAIMKLESHDALKIDWTNKQYALDTFDNLEALVTDKNAENLVENAVAENNIDLNKVVIGLLEFYGREKAIRFFSGLSYHERRNDGPGDLSLRNINARFSILLFEFKLRRSNASPDNKMILQALGSIRNHATHNMDKPFLFLIVFTDEVFQTFEKLKLQFRDLLNRMQEFNDLRNQLKFVPVYTGGLHLIDQAFEEFKKQFVQDRFQIKLQAQNPPTNFPGRNDHFLDATFYLKGTDFKIIIKPSSTRFWRLGLRFAREDRFPPITEDRHSNTNIADIHLSAGDITDVAQNHWGVPNQLTLTNYNATVIKDTIESMQNYSGEPVNLMITSNEDASFVRFSFVVNGRSYGNREFDLHEFNYCKIFAWADHSLFSLDADIEVTRK